MDGSRGDEPTSLSTKYGKYTSSFLQGFERLRHAWWIWPSTSTTRSRRWRSSAAQRCTSLSSRFSIDFQDRKKRIRTSIAPTPARESLAERCDSPTSWRGRCGAPPRALKLIDKDFVCAPRRKIIAFRRQMRWGPRGNPSLTAASPSTPGRGAALCAASYTSWFSTRPRTRKYRIPTLNAPRPAREVLAERCELFNAAKGQLPALPAILRCALLSVCFEPYSSLFRAPYSRAHGRRTLALMDAELPRFLNAKLAHIDVKCAGGVAM
ncbi:hypothetical protein GGG16DRAFT_119700 [Schizophyllum commune]